MDAAKLESLAGIVSEADALGGPTAEQAEQAAAAEAHDAAEDQAREWGVIAYTIGSALGMLAPELRQVYTESACLTWGRSVVPVAEKYGWNGPANVPEIGLAISTAGLAVPTFLLIRKRLAELRPAKARKAGEAGDVSDATVVESGQVGGSGGG